MKTARGTFLFFIFLYGEYSSHLGYENPYCLLSTAVQEERQRNKDRDGDYDCNTAANEEMPVEKILEAEAAVDHKTELHSASSSTGAVSVYLTVLDSEL